MSLKPCCCESHACSSEPSELAAAACCSGPPDFALCGAVMCTWHSGEPCTAYADDLIHFFETLLPLGLPCLALCV